MIRLLKSSWPAVLFIYVVGANAGAQARATSPVGTWTGTSRCTGASATCNDEHVVFRISAGDRASTMVLDGARVSGSDTVHMGALTVRRDTSGNGWLSEIPAGTWRFTFVADSLGGTLTDRTGRLLRQVQAKRVRR